MIPFGFVLNEKLPQLPMSVKGCTAKVKVFTKRLQRFALTEQESNGTHVTVVDAQADECQRIGVGRCCGVTLCHIVKNQIRPPVSNSGQHISLHTRSSRSP